MNNADDAITLLGRHHAGDESESGLKARLKRLCYFVQTHRDVPHYNIDPLDGRRIQYGMITYAYSTADDPAHFPWAAYAGDDDEPNYD